MSIVGVEVGKTSVVCCVLDSPQTLKTKEYGQFARTYKPITLLSDQEGIEKLLSLGEIYIIEPTGDYSRIWLHALRKHGKRVWRVSPKRVKALKEYSGIASKTDRYDAAFLAIYGALNQDDPSAFLSDYAEDLRETVLHHQFISRMTGNHQRRLWQLLSHEWPEVCRSSNNTKPQQNRKWLNSEPSALWRFIAGEKVRNRKVRQSSLDVTIGSGLSELSVTLAEQICALERQQFPLEERIVALLDQSCFAPYHSVFDSFGFAELTRAVLLSRIYPFENFLGEDGQPIRIKVPSSKTEGRFHRRDKSLGAFRLALGNGTRMIQSGQSSERRSAGSKVARCALYLHIKVKVVIWGNRGMDLPPYLRRHLELYQSLEQIPHQQAVSKIMSRLVKDLYRELLVSL